LITIYKSTENGLEVQTEPGNNAWINVVDPTTDEIEWLTSLGLPQDFVTYPLDVDERARTEREDDGSLLVLLRVPYFQGIRADVPYITIPLGVVTTGKILVTICRRPNDILQEFAAGRVRNLETGKRNRFILRLLLSAASRYLSYLREIDRIIDTVEDQLQRSQRNRELLELLKYQKSLVYFTTALKSNELMMERLQRWQFFRMYEEDEDLLEDVITENQQAIEMTNISTNILSSTMDAFASIISNNLNVVMKFLASATIVVNLPTIVYSAFGMNVPLPFGFESMGYAFAIIMGISLAIMIMVVLLFVRRDWF
jgi:magnesium transporter